MKRKYLTYITIILYIAITLICRPNAAFANESNKQDASSGFSYKVIYPENQHKEVSYFDLRMTPGQKQTVVIQLSNSSDKEITVDVGLNSTKTNSNGVLENGPSNLEKDSSLKYDFADIVKGKESVVIPPKQTIDYPIDITMPEVTYDGVISGGIYMIERDQESEKQEGMIKNKYAYLVGMLLTETDNEVKPDLKLNKVYADLKNYRNAIMIDFSNIQSAYLDDMTVDVQVMGAKSDEVLYDTKQTKMRMAPNSKIKFPVSMNGEKMVPGDYRAHILVTAKTGEKWEWEQKFTITNEEADKFNQEDVSLLQENRINWQLIILIIFGVLMLIVIIYFIVRTLNKKKNKKKIKNKKKAPKSKKR
ncbi:hypothetical protein BCR24_13160 [Enterococcus ureilyticus]|uniref:Uncharacterized protein n=1 Tax=Enterococcus ureilyticus TaxID=1131292 RepID=A0A1E5HE65_9ENTE|nr:DUF916 and DUF3324 domain-containing protein [Enterococcus ureilyticus]MBM7689834.1 hypothetical protein [Enterococcus ureilyticus]MBO0447716.1 DUF916 and DUF3324 domain-containing protein [Enterococcus ureilyticus]OEG23095.1 hypothetical protein BCR24_13160 [Enterococcus ureilyticus]